MFLEVYDALMQATVKLIDYWAKRKERINGLCNDCNVHLHRNCKPRFRTCSKSLVNYKEKLSKFCGHFANRIISKVYKKKGTITVQDSNFVQIQVFIGTYNTYT